MIHSMTGFGRGTGRAGDAEATVELRSVNGRYADVTVRAPRHLAGCEPAITTALKEALERGNITAVVTVSREDAQTGADLDVDTAAARAHADLLRRLRSAAGLSATEAPITLDVLLRQSDALIVGTPEDGEGDAAQDWTAVQRALDDATSALLSMRADEGAALRDDLTARVDAIETLVADVQRRAPVRVEEARERLASRLADVLEDERIDRSRIETEMAVLADKLDVTEECVRLRSHIAQFRDALAADEPVGRRLNFLGQEFNREINTIGSKAGDAEVARLGVAMKEELEKIREQVQNVV